MSEFKEEYIVKSIEGYPLKEGYVAVMLEPTVAMQDDEPDEMQMGVFPKGMVPPKELMQGLQMMMKTQNQQQEYVDCRTIILVISEIDFHMTGWHYGDIVSGDFKKMKEGKIIKPKS